MVHSATSRPASSGARCRQGGQWRKWMRCKRMAPGFAACTPTVWPPPLAVLRLRTHTRRHRAPPQKPGPSKNATRRCSTCPGFLPALVSGVGMCCPVWVPRQDSPRPSQSRSVPLSLRAGQGAGEGGEEEAVGECSGRGSEGAGSARGCSCRARAAAGRRRQLSQNASSRTIVYP